jgi:threonine dehydratase
MKIIIEPSSALAPATILGDTLGGSEDSAEWKRIVREVIEAKRERGEAEPEKLKVVVVISGGNVVLTQVLRMFEKLENEQ